MTDAMQERSQIHERRRYELGAKIAAARVDKGLSTRQLAAMIDPKLKHRYVQNVESGRVEPTLRMLEKICKALDIGDKQ
jgi:ribosome-binding protein aMBF1 (putative translation factor)